MRACHRWLPKLASPCHIAHVSVVTQGYTEGLLSAPGIRYSQPLEMREGGIGIGTHSLAAA